MNLEVSPTGIALVPPVSDDLAKLLLSSRHVVCPGWQTGRRINGQFTRRAVKMGWATVDVPLGADGEIRFTRPMKGGIYAARNHHSTKAGYDGSMSSLVWRAGCGFERGSDEFYIRFARVCGVPTLDDYEATLVTPTGGDFFSAAEMAARRRSSRRDRVHGLEPGWMRRLYLEQRGLCALTGLPMFREQRKLCPKLPVPDRIDSSGIYEPGNVRLLRHGVNMARRDMTDAAFIALCADVAWGAQKTWPASFAGHRRNGARKCETGEMR